MKLWLLEPNYKFTKYELADNPWSPWYDKCFGMVVSADTEDKARLLAQKNGGTERSHVFIEVWISPDYTTCIELSQLTEEQIILRDFQSA